MDKTAYMQRAIDLTDIALFVANLERAIDYYAETLGFELMRRDTAPRETGCSIRPG